MYKRVVFVLILCLAMLSSLYAEATAYPFILDESIWEKVYTEHLNSEEHGQNYYTVYLNKEAVEFSKEKGREVIYVWLWTKYYSNKESNVDTLGLYRISKPNEFIYVEELDTTSYIFFPRVPIPKIKHIYIDDDFEIPSTSYNNHNLMYLAKQFRELSQNTPKKTGLSLNTTKERWSYLVDMSPKSWFYVYKSNQKDKTITYFVDRYNSMKNEDSNIITVWLKTRKYYKDRDSKSKDRIEYTLAKMEYDRIKHEGRVLESTCFDSRGNLIYDDRKEPYSFSASEGSVLAAAAEMSVFNMPL